MLDMPPARPILEYVEYISPARAEMYIPLHICTYVLAEQST